MTFAFPCDSAVGGVLPESSATCPPPLVRTACRIFVVVNLVRCSPYRRHPWTRPTPVQPRPRTPSARNSLTDTGENPRVQKRAFVRNDLRVWKTRVFARPRVGRDSDNNRRRRDVRTRVTLGALKTTRARSKPFRSVIVTGRRVFSCLSFAF